MSRKTKAIARLVVASAALLACAGAGASAYVQASRTLGGYSVPALSEDSVSVDYRGDLNRWTVGGVVVPLDCPREDSCVADYARGAWHIGKVVP